MTTFIIHHGIYRIDPPALSFYFLLITLILIHNFIFIKIYNKYFEIKIIIEYNLKI